VLTESRPVYVAPLHSTATCIIIAPKRLKLRLSGSARKSQKRFRDTPRFKFRAVLARIQPFLSRSVEKRGDQSRFKCSKVVDYYAIRSTAQLSTVVKICSCALLADTRHCIADTWHSLRFVSGAGVAWSMRWRRCPRLSSVRKTHKSIAPCRAKTDHSFAETGSGQT
jgi:hypothetical protein